MKGTTSFYLLVVTRASYDIILLDQSVKERTKKWKAWLVNNIVLICFYTTNGCDPKQVSAP